MKFVSSADIGDLGPSKGTMITYNWKWYYNVPGMLLWIIFLGAIVFIKANRNRHVLLIFIPLFLVHLLCYGLFKLLNAPSADASQMDMVITSYATGLATLWLLAHKIENQNHLVTLLFAFMITVGFAIVGLISNSGWAFDIQGVSYFMIQIIMICAILLGFIIASWGCRKRYSCIKFMIFLALWTLLVCLAGMLAFYFILLGVQGVSIASYTIILVASIAGLVVGLICYLINLPFLILGFTSPFFRERFYACLRLEPNCLTNNQDNVKTTEKAGF